MPGARAMGKLAQRPMTVLPMTADQMVAAMAASLGMPASDRMFGLTKMM